MHPFEFSVLRAIREDDLIQEGEKVLAAVSGGADSVALLRVLKALSNRLDLKLTALHLNHRLRGRASDQDERFVRDLCSRETIELEVEELDQTGTVANLEAVLRRLRYQRLFRAASRLEAIVATGHSLNDQAETLLLKLARGAGLTGMAGIFSKLEAGDGTSDVRVPLSPEGSTRVVRPLLRFSRGDILAYLKDKGQDYRCDRSNRDLRFDRNWVRWRLLPLLEERLNPSIQSNLARTARILNDVDDFLRREASGVLPGLLESQGNDRLLSVEGVRTLHPALRREVLRQTIRLMSGQDPTGYLQVEAVCNLFEAQSGRQTELAGGLKAIREPRRVRFTISQEVPDFGYLLDVPGRLFVTEVEKVVVLRPTPAALQLGHGPCIRLSCSQVLVRNRRPGDRYRVAANRPLRKLKRILREEGVPALHRDRLIVLESEGEIVWVEGLAPNPRFRPDGTTDETSFEIEVESETSRASQDQR